MKRVLVLLCLVLAGCNEDLPVPVASVPAPIPLKNRIPVYLMDCEGEPDGQTATNNEDAAEYVDDLRDAGRDCRRKHKTLVKLIKAEPEAK